MRMDIASKPVVNNVSTARNGTAIIPLKVIERNSECSALITALYKTPANPQQPAALKARNIPNNSLSAKIYPSTIAESREILGDLLNILFHFCS